MSANTSEFQFMFPQDITNLIMNMAESMERGEAEYERDCRRITYCIENRFCNCFDLSHFAHMGELENNFPGLCEKCLRMDYYMDGPMFVIAQLLDVIVNTACKSGLWDEHKDVYEHAIQVYGKVVGDYLTANLSLEKLQWLDASAEDCMVVGTHEWPDVTETVTDFFIKIVYKSQGRFCWWI